MVNFDGELKEMSVAIDAMDIKIVAELLKGFSSKQDYSIFLQEFERENQITLFDKLFEVFPDEIIVGEFVNMFENKIPITNDKELKEIISQLKMIHELGLSKEAALKMISCQFDTKISANVVELYNVIYS